MKLVLEHVENSINLKIILGIIVISILCFLLLNIFKDFSGDILGVAFFVGPLVISISSFAVARLYWDSEIFGRSYLALSAAFLMYVFGEMIGNIYLADKIGYFEYYVISGFYVMYFPFIIYHLLKNIHFFSPNGVSKNQILFLLLLPLVITGYFYTTISETEQYHLLLFEVITLHMFIFVLELSIFGMLVFRNNILKTTWILIVMGVMLHTLANLWSLYEYIILSSEFDFVHPYNILWITSFMMIIYALIKHKQAL